MLNVPSQLMERDEPIRVGIIGAGLFGTKLADQIERAPGMTTSAIADIETNKAVQAYQESGVARKEVSIAEDTAELNDTVERGGRAIVSNGHELARSEVDVVVEATGIPDAGAHHAYDAIMAENDVVMATVEAETVVGPALAELADRAGVTYSMAYGDQPSLIVELYDWARTIGLDVVAAGKGVSYVDSYRHGTPDDVFDRFGFDEEYVEAHDLNPRMYNSFSDGTKVAVEMCAVANATGLEPDVQGMHLPAAEIPEIPGTLCPQEDGGILNGTGVVDTVSSLHADGSAVDHDIGFGVFVVTTTPNERVQEYLDAVSGSGLYVANDGKYQLFYRPYHLPGTETAVSVANATIRNEPTGAPKEQTTEVVAAAKKDLEPGDEIDGGGGYTVYGLLEKADAARKRDHVPFELLESAVVEATIDQDEIVTYDDVTLNEDSFIYRLRRVQEFV